jgi:hypothetical protein
VQLTCARLADAHLRPVLAQRELIAVIASDDLTLASRQPPQRVLNTCLEIFLLVPLGEAVVDGRALRGPLSRAASSSDTASSAPSGRRSARPAFIDAAELVDDRAADAELRRTPQREHRVGGRNGRRPDRSDHRCGGDVVTVGKR